MDAGSFILSAMSNDKDSLLQPDGKVGQGEWNCRKLHNETYSESWEMVKNRVIASNGSMVP